MLDGGLLGYGRALFDALDHGSVFFGGDGQAVKLIVPGVSGYPSLPSPSDYLDPTYDDSSWPDKTLPVLTDDASVIPAGATAVPAGVHVGADPAVDGGWDSRWIARAHVDFPDYPVPIEQQYELAQTLFHREFSGWNLLDGSRLYLVNFTSDNTAKMWIDGVIVATSQVAGFTPATGTSLVICPPGEHVVTLEKLGDASFDYLGIEIAPLTPLNVTVVVPEGLTGAITVTVHNAQLAVDPSVPWPDTDTPVEYFIFSSPRSGSHTLSISPDPTNRVITTSAFSLDGKGEFGVLVADFVWVHGIGISVPAPTSFGLLATTRAEGRITPALHRPRLALVPSMMAPPSLPTLPVISHARSWYANPESDSNYSGLYLRLFRVVTTAAIQGSAEDLHGAAFSWKGPVNPSDNNSGGHGMFLEIDLYLGSPGDPSNPEYSNANIGQPWDHLDRYRMWSGTDSGGALLGSSLTGTDIPAGSEVWLLCQQIPDFDYPDPPVSWDPTTDMGSWTDETGAPVLLPWDLATMVEIPIPVPSGFWEP